MARHMSVSFAQTLVGDHGLSQGKPAVVRRHLGVEENPKAAMPQLYHRAPQEVQVLKAAAAQAYPIQTIRFPNSGANLPDRGAQSVVEARGNFAGRPASGEVLYH